MGQYYYLPDPGEQRGGFAPSVPDQLAQLRQQQMQRAMMQGAVQAPTPPQQPDTGGIIWVQGEAGAKAYLVAPGNTVQLWDSENQVIYLKSADMSGMPSMRVLDYTERNAAQPAPQQAPQIQLPDLSNFITRDELENILAERLKWPSKAAQKKEDTENGQSTVQRS